MLIPAEVISVNVVSLIGFLSAVQGMSPLNGWAGISLAIHAPSEGGRKRKPLTTFSVLSIWIIFFRNWSLLPLNF